MSPGWLVKVKRIRCKTRPLTAAGVKGLRDEYTRTIEPARALAAETLQLERVSNAECGVQIADQAYALTPADIALLWKSAPPRMPIPPPAT